MGRSNQNRSWPPSLLAAAMWLPSRSCSTHQPPCLSILHPAGVPQPACHVGSNRSRVRGLQADEGLPEGSICICRCLYRSCYLQQSRPCSSEEEDHLRGRGRDGSCTS